MNFTTNQQATIQKAIKTVLRGEEATFKCEGLLINSRDGHNRINVRQDAAHWSDVKLLAFVFFDDAGNITEIKEF